MQLIAVLAALQAAHLWWQSSQIGFQPSDHLPKLADGNLTLAIGPHKFLVWDLDKAASLNSSAAICTAVAISLEVVGNFLAWAGRKSAQK